MIKQLTLALVAVVLIGTTPAFADPGSLDPADPYFPALGNRGYDVDHYDVGLSYTPRSAGGTGTLEGDVAVHATATEQLSQLVLDLAGFDVTSVRIDGRPAAHHRTKAELEITPAAPIAAGARFVVRVRYAGVPTHGKAPGVDARTGWLTTRAGAVTFNEPDGASHWFPSNDHPSDKATFTFRIDVPTPLVAVANGTLEGKVARGTRTIWSWDEAAPMATYLSQIAIGDLQLREEKPVDGVTIRNAYSPGSAKRAARAVADTPRMLRFLSAWFGSYPFSTYGVMVPTGVPRNLAFEAQTFSLVAPDLFDDPAIASAILAHELAHQWFGDSVSPATWAETWLNEGFATYAEWLWSDHALEDPIQSEVRLAMKAVRSAPDIAADAPGREEMFGSAPYERGGLTLHALRLEVSDPVFATIVRTYLERFRGRSATTEDFMRIADEVSGRDLGPFLRSWLGPGPLPRLAKNAATVQSDPPGV